MAEDIQNIRYDHYDGGGKNKIAFDYKGTTFFYTRTP